MSVVPMLFGIAIGMLGATFLFVVLGDHLSLRRWLASERKISDGWRKDYIETHKLLDEWVDFGTKLDKESREAREFWDWNRKYRRGTITEYRLAQRAKRRMGIE